MRAGEENPQGFLSSYIRKFDERLVGRVYLVTKSTPRVPVVRPLLAIGYKYNYRKVLVFIAAEGAGSNEPVYPYLYSFTDIYYNVSVRPVANPHLLDRYFNSCNAI